ncbi:MAG: DUF3090 domain-containing protein [Actinobacteria bacterium]|nr:DUF3090 domain-containing protein [Actinomycetota bacterium]
MIFDAIDRFIVGTVGQPGEREFFIQLRQSTRLVTVSIEKSQVAALTSRMEMLLSQLRKSGHVAATSAIDDQPLEQPIESDFVVGAISIAWNEETSCVQIELLDIDQDDEAQGLNLHISLQMAQSFTRRAHAVINAGRLPCPLCGLAIDPQGHLCPRANGYRR